MRNTHISHLRKARGLSQAELAQRIGVSQATVSRLESSPNGNWDYRMLLRLAEALGTEVRTLVDPPTTNSAPVGSSPTGELDADRLGLIAQRLRSPRSELIEAHRDAGAYEGLLLATHELGITDLRAIASIPPPSIARIGNPPQYRDEPWLIQIVEQNNAGSNPGLSTDDYVRQSLIDYGEAPDDHAVVRPWMYASQWPSTQCPLWNACAIIAQVVGGEKSRTTTIPPHYLPDHAQLLLSLHQQDRKKVASGSQLNTRLIPWSHLDIDAHGFLASDHEFSDLFDAEKRHPLPKGTPFEDVYAQFGGLRESIHDWQDPVANAWAVGLITQIRAVWNAVTTRLDGEPGCSGEPSSRNAKGDPNERSEKRPGQPREPVQPE